MRERVRDAEVACADESVEAKGKSTKLSLCILRTHARRKSSIARRQPLKISSCSSATGTSIRTSSKADISLTEQVVIYLIAFKKKTVA